MTSLFTATRASARSRVVSKQNKPELKTTVLYYGARKTETTADSHESAFSLLREICKTRLGRDFPNLDFQNTEICKTERGKPYFAVAPEVHFSVSHTNGFVAACVSDAPCGIDIQTIAGRNEKLEKRFFSPAENDFIAGSRDKDLAFTRIWAAKESCVKLTGEGIAAIRSFCVIEKSRASSFSFFEADFVPDGESFSLDCRRLFVRGSEPDESCRRSGFPVLVLCREGGEGRICPVNPCDLPH